MMANAKTAAGAAAAQKEAAEVPSWMDISDVTEDTKPDRLETTAVPLGFTSAKVGAGVALCDDSKTAASDGKAVGCQLADVWMAGGRNPLVWTCALVLEEVCADTLVGVVGRNYWPTSWDGEAPLATSSHAVVLRCGDGSVVHKGKGTSFVLRKLPSGSKINLTVDMQKLEMTVELLGALPGQVVSSITVEGIPSGELTLAVGFAAAGQAQRVRLVGCKSEKPEMVLTGKFHKDLWDEDNVIKPLQLNAQNRERGELQAHQNEAAVAASLE